MNHEKETIVGYTVEQSITIGNCRVILGVDQSKEDPFLVCLRSYDQHTTGQAIVSDDYLEAMQIFSKRIQEQVEKLHEEQSKWSFDMTPLTSQHCIPVERNQSIVGKVVVLDAKAKRYEYQRSAYQLILAEGGFGAEGRNGQAVFGKLLSDGSTGRWERFDVIGEIKPEYMPTWAKDGLAKLSQGKEKKSHSREER
jgi:hypothetical protein